MAFYHSRGCWKFRGRLVVSKHGYTYIRARVGVFVDYAASLDKIEHADRSVKQSIAMLSQQLLANVAIITGA